MSPIRQAPRRDVLLRRTQSIVLKEDSDTMSASPRSSAPRRGLGALRSDAAEPQPAPQPEPEAQNLNNWREDEPVTAAQLEHRRNIDRWRAEVLQSVAASEGDESDTGSRLRRIFKPANIALLAVALIAGGAAAWLAISQGPPPAPVAVAEVTVPVPAAPPEVVKEPMVQVLIAKAAIGIGQRLNAKSIEWTDWPEAAVRPEFVTAVAVPDALTEMDGAVARYDFLPGEPIREDKLARSAEGLLSAVLDPGTRAVAVAVSAESASGGFILPSDRVDVVLTKAGTTGQVSETILRNVRVLAINSALGGEAAKGKSGQSDDKEEEDTGPVTFSSALATLALDPKQSEVVISATMSGRLSLVLRPIADVALASDSPANGTVNQSIRMTSPFWK